MKKYHLWISCIILILFFSGCQDDDAPAICGSKNPAIEIAWLRNLIVEFDSNNTTETIDLYRYKGQYVFLITICTECTDNLTVGYDCDQNVICQFGGIAGFNTCPDFNDKAVFIETIQ